MSGPPVAVKRSLGTCVNPTCSAINSRTFGQSSKAPLKCGRCRTARYCGKDCQRAHWPQHKQYCAAWQQFSEAEGIPLAQIKVKMAHFIWLLRGFPEYVMRLFDEHDYHRRKHDPRGFIDFQFDSPEELFKAIDILQSQPIIEPDFPFAAMPGSPSFNGNPESTTKLPLRQVREEDEQAFANAVDARMAFTSAGDSRKNLQQVLDIAKKHRLMLVVSITVILPDSFATHMYDYMYRQISWVPELSPEEVYGPRKRKT